MSYAALMVYVEPDEAREGRVRLAAGLADKFGAALIGLSARSIAPPILANGLMMPSAPDINALQRQLADRGSWFGRIEHAVIGWKDTREARRAVQDSLPLLQKAARITIFEACGPDEEKSALARLDDVVRYLALHRIKSGPMVMVQKEGSGAAQLLELAKKERADLLVTGGVWTYPAGRVDFWRYDAAASGDQPDMLPDVALNSEFGKHAVSNRAGF